MAEVEKSKSSERLMAIVEKTAMLAIELPPDKREAFCQEKRSEYFHDAKSTGVSEERAGEWAEKLDEIVRDMVGVLG